MPSSLLSTLPLSCEICLSSPQPYEAGHNSEKVEALFIFGFTYVSVLVPALCGKGCDTAWTVSARGSVRREQINLTAAAGSGRCSTHFSDEFREAK